MIDGAIVKVFHGIARDQVRGASAKAWENGWGVLRATDIVLGLPVPNRLPFFCQSAVDGPMISMVFLNEL